MIGSPLAANFYRTRVRAYVPARSERCARRAEHPKPTDRALLVYPLADDRDRLLVATSRDLYGYAGIDESLYGPDRNAFDELERYAQGRRADVPPGVMTWLKTERVEKLGPLITRRYYRYRIPLVVWDKGRTLGLITAHTGRLKGTAEGFSLTLAGCGVVNAEGKWADSKYHPRYELVPWVRASPALSCRAVRPSMRTIATRAGKGLASTTFSSCRRPFTATSSSRWPRPASASGWTGRPGSTTPATGSGLKRPPW